MSRYNIPNRLAFAMEMKRRGASLTEIATKLHMSPSGVSRLLARAKTEGVEANTAKPESKPTSETTTLIVEVLKRRNWTQKQLANEVGVAERTLQTWINGAREPRGAALRRLQDLLPKEKELLEVLTGHTGTIRRLYGINDRHEAIKFIQEMQDNSKKAEREAWALAEWIVKFPLLIEQNGWFVVSFTLGLPFTATEANCFAQIEKALGPEIAWRLYCSYLAAYNDDERQIPLFLLDLNDFIGLAHRAGIDDEPQYEKYAFIDMRLRRRQARVRLEH